MITGATDKWSAVASGAWDVPDDDRNRPHGQERDNSDLPDGMWSPEAHP